MARKMTEARFRRLMASAETPGAMIAERLQEARYEDHRRACVAGAARCGGRLTGREFFLAFLAQGAGDDIEELRTRFVG